MYSILSRSSNGVETSGPGKAELDIKTRWWPRGLVGWRRAAIKSRRGPPTSRPKSMIKRKITIMNMIMSTKKIKMKTTKKATRRIES